MIIPALCIMNCRRVTMDKQKALFYINNSFLSNLLRDEDVTDITYNGVDVYYVSNTRGRMKSDILIEQQTVRDFLRQIANISEQQFSFTNPVLDVSIDKYRINATHQSIGKINNEDVVTFAIRVASSTPKINEDSDFFTPLLLELIKVITYSRRSIVIGGATSSGKTELQKFIISHLPENERVIVIDNVLELDAIRNDSQIDLTCWKVDEKNDFSSSSVLIKNALRNNPDWLILAEARDKEMLDVLNSAMTGVPLITTMHSYDIKSLPFRMGRMVLKGSARLDYDETLTDIYYHFHFYIYLRKEIVDGFVKRSISEVSYVDNAGQFYLLYQKNNDKHVYNYLPDSACKLLDLSIVSKQFKNTFIKGVSHE